MSDTKKNKKTTKKSGSAGSKLTGRRAEAVKKTAPKQEQQVEAVDRTIHQLLPYLFGVAAIFILICFFSEGLTGIVGKALRWLFYGLFGGTAFAVPVLLAILAVFWRKALRKGGPNLLTVYQAIFFIFLSAMIHIWAKGELEAFSLPTFWKDGMKLTGGGAIGGILGFALYQLTGPIGSNIIGIAAMVVFGLFMFGLTPYSIYVYIAYYLHERKERLAAEEAVAEEKPERKTYHFRPAEVEETPSRVKRDPIDRHRFEPDVEVGDGYTEEASAVTETPAKAEVNPYEGLAEEDVPPFDVDVTVERVKPIDTKKITRRPDSVLPKNGTPDDPTAEGKTDLQSIFTDPDGVDVIQRFAEEQKKKELERQRLNGIPSETTEEDLKVSRTSLAEERAKAPEVVKKEYVYPPISLLRLDNTPKNVDISEELHSNAVKLVETLRSFKVRTRIVNVSRGPAITRYELAPEEGVRVRAIANLVDDIALNLATTGVRIEAPIPGKAAVGIEVPNKSVSTVYLRELVDTETFRKAQSKLHVSLGVDVAGEPVYLDIAKMPHLLIAGATGMGKSVCINSVITSLLYKSSPEEVKLILIDPKKVELNIYNGLPHLLVPVVSEPKKAAGSLQWAVTEMERRFALIEEVGVRDVKMYNTVTKDDPEKEFLPQIVIIIDELADLMMTAPDDVEDSICRLAQKARAAGMHLIIGTQRPSVDVITGLIKANVPSRIAFTVASQTDSRVVLDMAGAEKLIGRGDMLYAPVGASKPRRVQGAFVSEVEVENVVRFIKEQNGDDVTYSSEIMDSIERAAAACGSGKKGGGGIGSADGDLDDGGDSMLRPAIELALETGKISTSLIQRRLSLGYGRAAKLIDEMEKRGIVSPPEGQKPRTLLITKQQYMEMVLNRSEEL
ncbi:MAG: DNA translocase FtsK [Ruminococcaceae bacterium]|nr:DNA translocase FtsK [Oscillospiraceae bacterium]